MWRLLAPCWIALLVLTGPAFARDGGTVVLVWTNATLYSAPFESAAHGRIQGWKDEARARSTGEAWTMRERAALDGGWVEVETLDPETEETTTCSNPTTQSALADVALHAFVRRADLAPVTTGRVRATFPDGSSIVLGPGVPLGPPQVADGGVPLRDFWTPELAKLLEEKTPLPPIELSASRVGEEAELFPLNAWLESSLDLADIRHGAKWVELAGRRRPLSERRDLLTTSIVRRVAHQTLVEFDSRCFSARGWIPSQWVHRVETGGGTVEGARCMCVLPPPSWKVRAGAAATWPDGRVLGQAREDLRLYLNPVHLAGRICFALGSGDSFACFEKKDLEMDPKTFVPRRPE